MEIKNTIFLHSQNCEVTDLGESCLMIYDIEGECSHVLNPVMSFLWQHCDGNKNAGQIVDELLLAFDTQETELGEIKEDCIKAFQQMYEVNIIYVNHNENKMS